MRNLIVLLGDQLSPTMSSLVGGDPQQDLVLMMEVQEEATYVRHHEKKIALCFSAMRHFAEEIGATRLAQIRSRRLLVEDAGVRAS